MVARDAFEGAAMKDAEASLGAVSVEAATVVADVKVSAAMVGAVEME